MDKNSNVFDMESILHQKEEKKCVNPEPVFKDGHMICIPVDLNDIDKIGDLVKNAIQDDLKKMFGKEAISETEDCEENKNDAPGHLVSAYMQGLAQAVKIGSDLIEKSEMLANQVSKLLKRDVGKFESSLDVYNRFVEKWLVLITDAHSSRQDIHRNIPIALFSLTEEREELNICILAKADISADLAYVNVSLEAMTLKVVFEKDEADSNRYYMIKNAPEREISFGTYVKELAFWRESNE